MNPFADLKISPEAPYQDWEGHHFADPVCPLNYRVKYPENINDGARHPLVLVLHGVGSVGDDNLQQLFLATLFTDTAPVAENGAIVLAPQCPAGKYWIPSAPNWQAKTHPLAPEPAKPLGAVIRLMEEFLANNPVDFSRIYLVGASMGAFAGWELLMRREWFAAAVLICGGGDPAKVDALCWPMLKVFHGVEDPVVPVNQSREMVNAVRNSGRPVELVELPGVAHDAWTPVLQDSATGKWLFDQQQKVVVSAAPGNREILELSAHGFSAKIAPALGGNICSLRDEKTGTQLLREALSYDQQAFSAVCFGIPTLFPPTRIDSGRFTFNGRNYSLPITDRINGHHLHGLVSGQPWQVAHVDAECAQLQVDFTAADPRFSGFPHEFRIIHEYRLNTDGLTDTTVITNLSNAAMPLGLGFHTAFPSRGLRLRFGSGDYYLDINRGLPTGRCLPWDACIPDPRRFYDQSGYKFDFFTPVSEMTSTDGRTFRGAELSFPNGSLTYELDEKFAFWCVWNCGGFNKFICLEPISWFPNCPNQTQTADVTNFRELAPGEKVQFSNRLRWLARN